MMKTTTKCCLFFFLVGILLKVTACKSVKEDNSQSAVEAVTASTYINDTPVEQDCYYPRKTIRSFENQLGTIILFSNEYVLTIDSPDTRYLPCDVPAVFRHDGLQVFFTGDKLEVFPQERRYALPLRLKSMAPAIVDDTK